MQKMYEQKMKSIDQKQEHGKDDKGASAEVSVAKLQGRYTTDDGYI